MSTNGRGNAASEKLCAYVFAGLLIVFLAAAATFFLTADIRRLLAIVPDDTFYYFKTAENLANGRGVTFDGINPTNGFQPLWLFLLVPVHLIVKTSPESMTRLVLLSQAVALAALCGLVYHVIAKTLSRSAALLGGSLLLLWGAPSVCQGMESAVLVVTLGVLFYYGWKRRVFEESHPSSHFVFGLILGLVMLSRLDYVAIALAIGAYGVLWIAQGRAEWRSRLVSLGLVIAGSVIVVLPYILYNQINFHNAVPISGQLKAHTAHVWTMRSVIAQFYKPALGILVVTVAYVLVYFAKLRRATGLTAGHLWYRTALVIFGLGLLLHTAMLFYAATPSGWYYAGYFLFASLLVSEIYFTLGRSGYRRLVRVLFWPALAVILLTGTQHVCRTATLPWNRSCNVALYDVANWLKTNTAPDDVSAALDSGIMGYFSGRSVVNLDGLVNSVQYQEALRDRRFVAFLQRCNVKYLCYLNYQHFDTLAHDYDHFRLKYYSRLFGVTSDDVLVRQGEEVLRTPTFRMETGMPVNLIMWKVLYDIQVDDKLDEAVRVS